MVLGIEPRTLRLQGKYSTNFAVSQSLEPLSTMFLLKTRIEKAVAGGPQKMPTELGGGLRHPVGILL